MTTRTTNTTSTTGLAARLAVVACVSGPFTLADGQGLDSYFDEFRLAADPHLLHDVADAMAALVPETPRSWPGSNSAGYHWSSRCRRPPACPPRSSGDCPSATEAGGRSKAPTSTGGRSYSSTTWSARVGNC